MNVDVNRTNFAYFTLSTNPLLILITNLNFKFVIIIDETTKKLCKFST